MGGPRDLFPVHLVFLVLLPGQVLPELLEFLDDPLLLPLRLLRLLDKLGPLLLQRHIVVRDDLPHILQLALECLLQLFYIDLRLLLIDRLSPRVLRHKWLVRVFVCVVVWHWVQTDWRYS